MYDTILGLLFIARPLRSKTLASEGCREDLSCAKRVRARTPQDVGQSQQRKDEGGSFRGSQFGVGDPFPVPPFAHPSAWKDSELNCNRAVEVDCARGFTVASIQNGVIASGLPTGPAPESATTRPASIHLGPSQPSSRIA